MATPLTHSCDVYDITSSQTTTDFQNDYQENWPPVTQTINNYYHRFSNNRQQICLNRFPILKWLPNYKLQYLLHDFIAGLTVGLTAIPQGIAYAIVAGLPPQYGLYSGFVGCFVYFILGSCKDVTIGPTAIIALLVQKYVAENEEFAVFLAFINGLLIFIFGLFNLGFLVQFISMPVTVGFTTAAAFTIGSSQIKSLLGLKGSTNEFIPAWINVITNIKNTKLSDTLLGVFTIAFLIALKNLKYKRKITENDVNINMWKNECFKYFSLGRNAIAVILGTILAYVLHVNGNEPFELTGKVASGLPSFNIPPFELDIQNKTMNFSELITHLGSSVIAIPLISILESIAIAKAFSKGKTIDATQEMLALGMCNLLSSFFHSMPTTGSFTRTTVNNASGVRTTLGGLFTGGLVLLSLGLLTTSFQYIPKCTLAAVILCAMYNMVDKNDIIEIWLSKRIDILPFLATFFACLLLTLEFGIIVGIMINMCIILYKIARPNIFSVNKKILEHEVLVLTPDQSLTFSSADYFKYKILKYASINHSDIIIINGLNVQYIDSTAAKSLESVIEDLHLLNKNVYFWNWNRETIGVMYRTNAKHIHLFRVAANEEDLLKIMNTIKNPSTGSMETAQTNVTANLQITI